MLSAGSSAAVEAETASQEQEVRYGYLFGHLRRRLDEASDEHIRKLTGRFKKVAKWLPPADDTVKDMPKSVSSALWSFLSVFLWVTFGLREVDTLAGGQRHHPLGPVSKQEVEQRVILTSQCNLCRPVGVVLGSKRGLRPALNHEANTGG